MKNKIEQISDYYSIENQQQRRQERKIIEKEKLKFKELLQNPDFIIKPQWHLEKKNIDFKYLKDEQNIDIKTSEDYTLFCVKVEKVFNILCPQYKKAFSNKKIWEHDEDKTTFVLKNWEDNIKLIPIILIFNEPRDKMVIFDGNNRFAVLNYFKVTKIPIIILKKDESDFINIINNEIIKKIE